MFWFLEYRILPDKSHFHVHVTMTCARPKQSSACSFGFVCMLQSGEGEGELLSPLNVCVAHSGESCSDEEDPTNNEEEEVTDIDMMDNTVQPLATIPGGSCLKEYRILPKKREILTHDSAGVFCL